MKENIKELRKQLLEKMHIFKGDKLSKEHISELLELIDPIYEQACKYEDLCK